MCDSESGSESDLLCVNLVLILNEIYFDWDSESGLGLGLSVSVSNRFCVRG